MNRISFDATQNLCWVLLVPLAISNAFGQDIITDRPDQTESPATLAKNYFQIETGTYLEVDPETRHWALNSNLFRYGLVNNVELRLVSELNEFHANDDGSNHMDVGNMEVGAKIRLINTTIELAYLSHVIFPSGTEHVDHEKTVFSNKLCLSHPVADNIDFGYNLGFVYADETNNALIYTWSVGIGLTDKAGFFTEIYGEWQRFENLTLYYDNGFTYLVRPNIQLDFSFGTGISQKYNLYSAGVSWRLPG